jgi:RNA polymerase sigma-70 factor, ECF subfamily
MPLGSPDVALSSDHSADDTRSNDRRLAGRCARGERLAQEQLFEDQCERVHVVLFRILGSNRDMEDLVQEAFVALFRSLASYRGEASLATWTDRIAARTAFRYLSRRRDQVVHLELVEAQETAVAEGPDRDTDARALGRRLYGVLERLDPKYRIAFALHVIDERPISEVAEILEISAVAAKTRIWRARRQIQRRLRTDPMLRELLNHRGPRGT